MKVIFRLKSISLFNRENYVSMARNIINMWNNMKDLDAMVVSTDVEVYVVDDDSKAEVIFDDKQEVEEVEAIPIEFIKKYYEDITMPHTDTRIQFEELIRKWEKENETN